MGSLDYATCCKLRDAGFPQGGTTEWWGVTHEPELLYYRGSCEDEIDDPINTADCPNSDELLAALQARWPGLKPMVGYFDELWPDETCGKWVASDAGNYPTRGDTPAAALAALYLALSLAQQEGRE